jgi:hypothetical protein
VAFRGTTVVAGAPGWNGQQGAAYEFTEPSTGWQNENEAAKVTASDGAAKDWFGDSVALGDDTIVSGAPYHVAGSYSNQGSAYVYTGPPQNTTLPAITGTPQDGQTLQTSLGKWSSPDKLSWKFQWKRCSSTGTNCTAITGASRYHYRATSADVGHELTVTLTATDLEGQSGTGTATAVGPASPPPPPQNVTLPSISGKTQVGQVLQAYVGQWSSPDKLLFGFKWQRCSSTGTNCQAIAGRLGPSYTLTSADLGHELTVVVTAKDQEGQTGSATAPVVGPVS